MTGGVFSKTVVLGEFSEKYGDKVLIGFLSQLSTLSTHDFGRDRWRSFLIDGSETEIKHKIEEKQLLFKDER